MSADKITQLPLRIFGPLEPEYVSELIEDTLNDESLEDTLTRFVAGDIEPRQMAHEIQIIMEANYLRRYPDAAKSEAGEL